MSQRTIDLTLAFIASIVGFALSWPFWRDYGYWAESAQMWWLYFAGGFVLAIYVFYAFIRCTRTLFRHDTMQRANDKAGAP